MEIQAKNPTRKLSLSCSYSYTCAILTDLIDFLVTPVRSRMDIGENHLFGPQNRPIQTM